MSEDDNNSNKKIKKPGTRSQRSNSDDLTNKYSPDLVRTKLAGSVTNMLIFVILFNTIMTSLLTLLMGSKLIELDDITYVSFLVSSIGVIGISSLIVKLLPTTKGSVRSSRR